MARKYEKKTSEKVARTMREFKEGTLRSGSGGKVTSRKQAIAIGLSQARAEGYKVPSAPAHAVKKTSAQLNREIADVLSGSRSARSSHATKKDYDWKAFADGAAFAFWASPYRTEVQNLYEDAREAKREGDARRAAALEKAYDALSPGSGGRWDDVLPETPPAARAIAKKFTKAAREQLSDEQLSEVDSKFSAYDAGYRGAMQSQGEGIGWHDEGVKVDPPEGFGEDAPIWNAVSRAISKGAREAGVKTPLR
jgi:Family of unknown function (DUF6496)